MRKDVANGLFLAILLLTQICAAVFYGIFNNATIGPGGEDSLAVEAFQAGYPWFQDVHVMVFVGMAFLLAFMAHFQVAALAQAFWIAALTLQYYFLWQPLWTGAWKSYGRFYINTASMVQAEFCAFAMLIAFGAVVGKVNNLQMIIAVIIFVFLYTLNKQIIFDSTNLTDVGGSIYVFEFGGFFGLGLSWMISLRTKFYSNYYSKITSSTFAMIGTLFLWCFWPSFNTAAFPVDNGIRTNMVAINTYFCLIGSLMGTVFMSTILNNGKVSMQHILNASICGGVLMGAGADLLADSFVAYIVGAIGGVLCCLSYHFVDPILRRLGLHDIGGITHLFAISGMHGGWLSAVYRARYLNGGGYQIAGTFISLGIAFGGGLVAGLLGMFLGSFEEGEYFTNPAVIHFDDVTEHNLPQDYEGQRFFINKTYSNNYINNYNTVGTNQNF